MKEEKAPEPVAETPKEEEKKEEAPKEEPVVAEKTEEAPKEEQAEVAEATAEETDDNSPLKVVGKVDLDALKPKKKPKPKAEEKAEKKEEKKVAKLAEKPAAKAEPKKKEEPAKKEEAPKQPAKPAEPEFIKTEVKKLSGPTVVGKIELPKEPVKKKREPVASSSDANLKKKRKR
ncbi:MAG: translation initiation factor IF-2, partial [Bacteroidota bacterium]